MSSESADLQARVSKVLAEKVTPMLQMDGGAIELLDIIDGVVRIRLHGACSGCPSTIISVVMGIEQELRRHVPEVEYLEAVP